MIRRFVQRVLDVLVTVGVHLGIVRWPDDDQNGDDSDTDTSRT